MEVRTYRPIVTYSTLLRPDGRKYTCYFQPGESDFQALGCREPRPEVQAPSTAGSLRGVSRSKCAAAGGWSSAISRGRSSRVGIAYFVFAWAERASHAGAGRRSGEQERTGLGMRDGCQRSRRQWPRASAASVMRNKVGDGAG